MFIKTIVAILCMSSVWRHTAMASVSTNGVVNDANDWWRHAVFYQIYPRSFMDTNFDGIGDLRGITHRLKYLYDTGITAIWLSPIFQGSIEDFGYAISDYTDIHADYGTMKDFEELAKKAKRLNIKIILDIVPNHTSDQNLWFKKSCLREQGYEDFYIWSDGKVNVKTGQREPPNNWNSVLHGSAWSWHPKRHQYYLHQFSAQQPDLNFRNPAVIKTIDDIFLFWLNKGVHGFRIIAASYLYKNSQFRDEPLSGKTRNRRSYEYTEHIYTKDLPEVFQMLYHWRSMLDDYTLRNSGPCRILMTDAHTDLKLLANYYESEEGLKGAHIPLNFLLLTDLTDKSDGRDFAFNIQKWLICMPGGQTANWIMGSHDQPRLASKFTLDSVDAINMLLMTLPGIAITYSGEELGMQDNRVIKWQDTKDPVALSVGPKFYQTVSRDPVRTPFQWSAEKNAGFSNVPRPWLPVHPNYERLNLKRQLAADRSHYKVYKSLINLRREPVLRDGRCQVEVLNKWVFAIIRSLKNHPNFITVINVGPKPQVINAFKLLDDIKHMRILITGTHSKYNVGFLITTDNINKIRLAPHEGIVCLAA